MIIFPLYSFAYHLFELFLSTALFFDGVMCKIDGFNHFLFRYFIHLAFHHGNIFTGSAHNQVDIGFYGIGNARIYDKITVGADMGPLKGMSETASADEAAKAASPSGSTFSSEEIRLILICVSAW